MDLAVFLEGEAAVAACRIEARHGVTVMRFLPGFLDGQGIGSAAAPVISVGANREDQLIGRDGLAGERKLLGEPRLPGDRPWLAALPVIVVVHEDDIIDSAGELAQIPVGLSRRGGYDQLQSGGGKPGMGPAQHCRVGSERGSRHIFDIKDGALPPGLLHRGDYAVGERVALFVVSEHARHAIAIPLFVRDILHHQQETGLVELARSQRAQARVVLIGEGSRRHHHLRLRGNHPIEIVVVIAQRSGAVRVPRNIKTDPQRPGRCRGNHDTGQLVPKSGNMGNERQRLRAFAPQRQRRFGRNRHERRGEHRSAQHDKSEKQRDDAAYQPAPVARFIKKDRRSHCCLPVFPISFSCAVCQGSRACQSPGLGCAAKHRPSTRGNRSLAWQMTGDSRAR